MEAPDGTSLWPWILGGLGLVVGVVALVIAISANNDSTDNNKLVNETAAQVREEISGVGGAVAEADESAAERNREEARDRARMKREISRQVKAAQGEFESLNTNSKGLRDEVVKLKKDVAQAESKARAEAETAESLGREVKSLDKRVSRLEG
jgi:predicted RNase H-like nuclease (RuvC/YqgF family)